MADEEAVQHSGPKAEGAQAEPARAGDMCPFCGFARLQQEPRGHVRCPICGFTTAPPCT